LLLLVLGQFQPLKDEGWHDVDCARGAKLAGASRATTAARAARTAVLARGRRPIGTFFLGHCPYGNRGDRENTERQDEVRKTSHERLLKKGGNENSLGYGGIFQRPIYIKGDCQAIIADILAGILQERANQAWFKPG
jgi:hypothetical protein